MTFDGKAFGAEIVGIVKGHVERCLAPVNARLDAMEKAIANLPVPKDGKDADVDEIAALAAAALLPDIMEVRSMVEALPAVPDVPAMIAEAIAAIPTAPTDDDLQKLIRAEVLTEFADRKVKEADERLAAGPQPDIKALVAEAVAAIPVPVDGKDADPDLIRQMVAVAVAALPPAEKGKDADPVEVAAQIKAEVERAVAALPAPQDGKSVTVEELLPAIEERIAKAMAAIPVPKDGVDGKDGRDGLDIVRFIRDDKGHLNGILRDGTTVDLGEYVGRDGAPGRDGADGLGFEEMEERVEDEGRTIVRTYKKGDQVKEFRHKTSIIIYRDVFKEGQVYQRGDVATFGGSSWHCNLEDTTAKPGTVGAEKAWTLMTKRGRDGKDGQMKPAPKSGPVKVG